MLSKILQRLNDESFVYELDKEFWASSTSMDSVMKFTRTRAPQLVAFFGAVAEAFGPGSSIGITLMLWFLKKSAEVEKDTKEWFADCMRSFTVNRCVSESRRFAQSPVVFVTKGEETIKRECPEFKKILVALKGHGKMEAVMAMLSMIALFAEANPRKSDNEKPGEGFAE